MTNIKTLDLNKEYARKYSFILDKKDINLKIYGMIVNESLSWLLKDLTENKNMSIYSVGKILSGIFPELIQYNFSRNAISGDTPMFYFYDNKINLEYFSSKLQATVRDIYLSTKLIDSEKEIVSGHLVNLLNLCTLDEVNVSSEPNIFNKAIKYHMMALLVQEEFEVSIEEIKRVYPSSELVMKKGNEDRLASSDSRIVDLMISNNGSDLECVTTPIGFKKMFYSYVINFDVQDYIGSSVEVFYSCSIRRWINEKSLSIDFDGEKSVYFSKEGSNKLIKLNFENKKTEKESVVSSEDESLYFNKENTNYSLSVASQHVIKDIYGKRDFWEILDNLSDNMYEGKGFVGVPVSQDVVGKLTKGRYFKLPGEGTLDSLFFYEKLYEIFSKEGLLLEKSPLMPIIDSKVFSIRNSGSFDMDNAYITGDCKNITVFYIYTDEKLRELFLEGILDVRPNKDLPQSFSMESVNDNVLTLNSNIGDRKIQLKIVFIEDSIFQDLLPKFDTADVDSKGKTKSEVKRIIAENRKRNINKAISRYRDFIADAIDKYVEDNDFVASIVDIPNYHESKYTYRDPYKYVKSAFLKEGQHVQVKNCTEYDEENRKSIVSIFLSSLKDIYTKFGIYMDFKNKIEAFEKLDSIGIRSTIFIGYINIQGINIAATIKMSKDGMFIKVPKFVFEIDKAKMVGVTSWIPLSNGLCEVRDILKNVSLFKGKKKNLRACIAQLNIEFLKTVAVDTSALYVLRNVLYKNLKEVLSNLKFVTIRDEVVVKHGTFKREGDDNYRITASCMVARDDIKQNTYISTSTRHDTLQKVPPISSRFIQQNKDVRRARAVLFDVINIDNPDVVACLIHDMRKMSCSFETSTNLPHPLYLLNLLGDEVDKAAYIE